MRWRALTQDTVTGVSRLRLSNQIHFTGVAHGRVQLLRMTSHQPVILWVAMRTTSVRCSTSEYSMGGMVSQPQRNSLRTAVTAENHMQSPTYRTFATQRLQLLFQIHERERGRDRLTSKLAVPMLSIQIQIAFAAVSGEQFQPRVRSATRFDRSQQRAA